MILGKSRQEKAEFVQDVLRRFPITETATAYPDSEPIDPTDENWLHEFKSQAEARRAARLKSQTEAINAATAKAIMREANGG